MEKTTKEINENAACWYAVYTAARAENKVKRQLEQAGYESYQPLQTVIRIWGNRKIKLEVPVVPGFLFVCLSKEDVAKVAAWQGVFILLKKEGEYLSTSDKQLCVENLKIAIQSI